MWGDHRIASLRRSHNIYYLVRTGLAFLFLHLPPNDTISRILWMRNGRHIFSTIGCVVSALSVSIAQVFVIIARMG